MNKNKTILFSLAICLFYLIVYIVQPFIENNIKIITAIIIIVLCSIFGIVKHIRKSKITYKEVICIIVIFGVIIRAMYIIYTPVTERQHDVYSINDEGHLGYIYTIYQTGDLPQTNNIQFYHPPLFHSLSAGWLSINDLLNVNLERSIEGIQVLTAIFSALILIVTYKIVEEIKIKNNYKVLIMAMMAFHPTFIILAGSINNDILMILLCFCIIYYLIKWRNDTNIGNTIALAIFTGLCVMAKVSGAIMAIPIIFIFIDKLYETLKTEKNKLLGLFAKFILFGIISLPLGLWHPIRNAILFNQPIGGVLFPSSSFYIGNHSAIERFFTVSVKELFGQVYCVIPGNYNVFSYIVKTSILGEYSYNNITLFVTLFKFLNLIMIIISLVFTFILMIKQKKKNGLIVNIILTTFFIHIISYYSFNTTHPYTCTMDFRYIVPAVFTGITTICIVLDNFIKNEIIKEIIENIIILFCVFSIGLFYII